MIFSMEFLVPHFDEISGKYRDVVVSGRYDPTSKNFTNINLRWADDNKRLKFESVALIQKIRERADQLASLS